MQQKLSCAWVRVSREYNDGWHPPWHISTCIFIYRWATCTCIHLSLYVNTNTYLHRYLCVHAYIHVCVSIETSGRMTRERADWVISEKNASRIAVWPPTVNMMRSTWNWKESLSTSDPECLYHTMPSLMSCWVKEVVGDEALPSGKSCHESAGPSAGIGTRSTTSPGKSKDEKPGHNLWENKEEEVPFHQLMSIQDKCPPSLSFFPSSVTDRNSSRAPKNH